MRVVLDVRKSVEANAAVYFEKAKKARRKLEGAKAALGRLHHRLQQLATEKGKAEERFAAEAAEKERLSAQRLKREWYEKFRWFVSSEGFLCIGGRDATTNEIIIKKHTDRDDIVFHTELAGSPFFVIKTEGRSPGGKTLEEAATATAGYSRAWKAGLQSVDVYWIKPEQVSKEAKAGEYLTKGAFMIYGKKNFVPAATGLAIGVTAEGKITGGPVSAVAAHCSIYARIVQGSDKPSDAAKKVAKILGLGSAYLDGIISALPGGECKVVMT